MLGIVQNSLKDWTFESSHMGAIYRHGILNIAVTGFADGESVLFVEGDPNLLIPIAVNLEIDQYVLIDPQSNGNRQ